MEELEQLIQKTRQKLSTSGNSEVKTQSEYKCNKCRDTGWVLTERGTYAKCDCVELDYIKRLWDNSGIKADQKNLKLNDYKPYDEVTKAARAKAVEYIKSFEEIKDTRENSFGLFGQPGAGKTHIVIAIGTNLINREANPVPVVYMPYLESMRELKANTLDDEYYNKLINRYSRAKLLIIDDLFKDKVKKGRLVGELSESDMKHIYPILNYRYNNRLPMLVSSECTPRMLFDLDEALAGRIIEACGDNITVFKDQKNNYRMRKFFKEG
ncbi:MAG: DnaA/Hda family protein [Bacillota bacterium]|nr:DnaA/Hda family protein [Bacillota bacterium]